MNAPEPHRMAWRTSSYSTTNGDCVEVATGAATYVRDTKNRTAGHLALNRTQWLNFVAALKTS